MGIEVSSYALSPNWLLYRQITWWIGLRGIQYPVFSNPVHTAVVSYMVMKI